MDAENRLYDWLRLDDPGMLRICDVSRFRSGGPGGQHRNKVETAVRLRHRPTGIVAEAKRERSQEANRVAALRQLRLKLATSVRSTLDLDDPALPSEFVRYRSSGGRLAINERNPDFPIVLATALDAYSAAQGRYAAAAVALGVTSSQLARLLRAGAPQHTTRRQKR